MSEGYNSAKDEEAVYRHTAAFMNKFFSPHRTSVALLEKGDQTFKVAAFEGEFVKKISGIMHIEGTRIAHIVKTMKLWYTADITKDTTLDTKSLREMGVHSTMNCPLISGGKCFGSLNVASLKVDAFTEEDQNLLFQVASHLASTIANRKKVDELSVLTKKLAKYLSPQIYNSIFSGKKEVKLESERKKLTIFFSNIEGFTALTDTLESEELTQLLNEYLNEMAAIALQYGGTLDKFIGDAIMIFFGDPESKGAKEDARLCVSMALDMQSKMKELKLKWYDRGLSTLLSISIGINSGYSTVGNFGSDARLDYTVIGGQVNLARQLDTSAEPDHILITHQTFALIKEDFKCEKLGVIKVEGIAYPVQTYQVIEKIN